MVTASQPAQRYGREHHQMGRLILKDSAEDEKSLDDADAAIVGRGAMFMEKR